MRGGVDVGQQAHFRVYVVSRLAMHLHGLHAGSPDTSSPKNVR